MSSESSQTSGLTPWQSLKGLFSLSRGFWLVNMVNFGDGIAYFGILTLLTRFLGTRLGMSDKTTGMTVSMFTGLVTLFMFVGGFVSDKLGVRRALTWSLVVLLAGRVALTTAPALGIPSLGVAICWIGLILMGAGTGVLQPALYAGTKEYTDPRAAAMGYSFLYAIMNLGIVAENFLSPFVRTNEDFFGGSHFATKGLGWGIDGVFWLCIGITAFMLCVHLFLFTKKIEASRVQPLEHKPEAPQVKLSWKQKLRELPFLDPRFAFFIFILLPVRTLFAHQYLTMPDYVFRAYPQEVGARFEWISGLNPLIIVFFVPLIGAFTSRVHVIKMMILGTAVSALTTFILAPGANLNALLIYTILFSIGEALWSSRFLEYVAELAPPGKVGAYMGLAGVPWFFAKLLTGFYSGFMLNKFVPATGVQDSGTLWLIYGVIACISPVGLLVGYKWLVKGERKAEPAQDVEVGEPA